MFISGYANPEDVFYYLNIINVLPLPLPNPAPPNPENENESSSFFQALNMLGNPHFSVSQFNIQVIPVVNSLVSTVRDSLEKQVLAWRSTDRGARPVIDQVMMTAISFHTSAVLAYQTFFLNHPSIISLLLSIAWLRIAWLRQDRHCRTRSNGHPGDASAIFGKIILRIINFLAHHLRCGRSSKKASFKLSYFDLISGECLLTEFLIDQVSRCIQTWETS